MMDSDLYATLKGHKQMTRSAFYHMKNNSGNKGLRWTSKRARSCGGDITAEEQLRNIPCFKTEPLLIWKHSGETFRQ